MKQLLLICAVVALVGGCGGKKKAAPDASANKLFVEAVQLITSAEEQTGEAAIKDYEQALGKLGEIIANYSESDLAVKLISGETLFTGKSLKEIKERVKELKAEAERVAEAEAERERLRKAYDRIKDPVEKAIRRSLGKPVGELTQADLEWVTKLSLVFNKLTDVKGLEKLTKLEYLVLSHQLTEMPKELEKLTQLTGLYLNDNQLTDVKGLEKLTQLQWLSLYGNQLTDVKGLENLTQLTHLRLFDNKLTDVKGLETLTQLTKLYLLENQLTNVKGLEKLTQLKVLALTLNPDLTKAQIAELQKALPKCYITSNPKK